MPQRLRLNYDLLPFDRNRELVVDAGYLAARRHIVYGLVEVDVTRARELLRISAGSDGRPLSFTAFIVANLARAVAADPSVQAYRTLRRRLVVFHDVDVVTMVEPAPGSVAIPHIVRGAQSKSVREISDEIRSVQASPDRGKEQGRLVAVAPHLPRFIRLLFFSTLKANPHWFKRMEGTVVVTSVGMFGRNHSGWGIAFLPTHTLGLTIGGIGWKPAVHQGVVRPREFLDLTIGFDHDVVDGASAARFAKRLVDSIESAVLLEQ